MMYTQGRDILVIDIKDRIPTQPNRKKITYDDGRVEYVTIEYADNPTEPGTPINKVLFDSIKQDILNLENITGSYTGDDASTLTFNIGFTPCAGIVIPNSQSGSHVNMAILINTLWISYNLRAENSQSVFTITATSTGFSVPSGGLFMNRSGVSYEYIFFK